MTAPRARRSEPASSEPASTSELLAVVAARSLIGRRVVFAGHGLPTLAVYLAQRLYEPNLEIVYESGVTGAHPRELPTSISDSMLVDGAECVMTMPQVFGYMIQGGRIDVAFLGAAQIDRLGSLNSTLIGGTYQRPEHRLPGSGGAVEVMSHAREVFVVMRSHSPKTLVATLDFCTTPSPVAARLHGPTQATGDGVTTLVTALGTLRWSSVFGELALTALSPGVDVDQVVAATGWALQVAEGTEQIEAPTVDELRILRTELDPRRIYLR